MMVLAKKLGVGSVCAVLVWGCADQPKTGPEIVPNLSYTEARACRVVGTLNVENQSTPNEDFERGAMRKARSRAIEMGGDAVLIKSTSVSSWAAGGSSVMTLTGEILACNTKVAAR